MPVISSSDFSLIFIELGLTIIGLAILTRLADRWGFSTIPLYLVAGLAFGNGGLAPLSFSTDFIHVGSEIGILLLLFMLGLEYTGSELISNLRSTLPAGFLDFLLNFLPGFVAAFLLGWGPQAGLLLGGVTAISSSGIIAKVLAELNRMGQPETPVILSILVLEDLAMAIYLPFTGVILIGLDWKTSLISILIALAAVTAILWAAVHYGDQLSRLVAHESDEVVLFTVLGLVLLVAGVAQALQVSAAIGAFLVGIALSGPIVKQAHRQLAPLRDLFAAIFFLFFGLQIDPSTLLPVLLPAAGLGILTAGTKIITGVWAGRQKGIDPAGCIRAGLSLIPRGEFSIVIAGLGMNTGITPALSAFSAAYVLILAILGPILIRYGDSFCRILLKSSVPPG